MTKRRKKYQEKEEIRHPDSPEGLVVAAANNRAPCWCLQTSQSRSETWASLS